MTRDRASLLAVILAAAILLRGVVADSSSTCTTLTATDVPFCSMLAGRQVDSYYTAVSPAWNSLSYNAYIDGVAQSLYNSVSAGLQTASSEGNFQVCGDCATQLKWLICEGAFPDCGFYSCLNSAVMKGIAATCPNLCMCKNCSPFVSLNCSADGGVPNPNYNISGACDFNQLASNIEADAQNCSSFVLSATHCQTFVNVCSCGKANGEKLCSQKYAGNGFSVTGWPTGSCSADDRWCSVTKELVLQSRDSVSFCPNSDFCVTIPDPLASKSLSVSAGGVTASTPTIGSIITSTPVVTVTSGAGAAIITPLSLFAVLFLGVLLV